MGITQGAGIFAQALMHHAEQKRLEQNRGLDALKDAMNSVDVAPDTRQELTNYYVQSLGTPSHKFNAQKFSQGFGDIIGRDHARALDLAQQQSGNLQNPQPLQDLGGFAGAMQLPTTPPPSQVPSGVGQPQPLQPPPALDQLPPTMSSIPQAQLQAPQVQPRPFFDPFRGADVTGRVKAMEAQAMLPTTFQELQGRADIGNQAQMQLGQMRLKALEPYISSIQDPLMQNMMRMEAVTGGNPGNMFAPLMSATFAAPTRIPIDATGMSKEQKIQLGLPENATGKQTILMDRFRNVIGTLPGWEGTALTTSGTGEVGIVNRAAPGVVTPLVAPGGGPAINPAMMPTQSSGVGMMAVQQPDGSIKLVPVSREGETRKVGPAATGAALPTPSAPPVPGGVNPVPAAPISPPPKKPTARVLGPGTTVGGKSLTPDQMINNAQVAEQLNNTIGIIKDLQKPESMKVLGNLVSSGKIQMQIDPEQHFWRAIINKNMALTPQEDAVARDWQLLTEGVLQMRIPMGGAGFRGKEGFGAIESNKGILGQHPEIIKGVLDGTLREFRAQRDPLVEGGKKYGYKTNPEMGPIGETTPPPANAVQFKPGDTVTYQGRPHKVKSVDSKTGKLTLEP